MKVFINPGHGGTDPGAYGNGLKERDVVLKIGTLVAQYLRNVGYDVKLFQFDGLAEICDAANDFNADIFVSIHCNAGGGIGTESYFISQKGKKIAQAIHRQLVNSLPLVDRGIKSANFFVLNYTAMPACLVETAFIDNTSDAKLLANRHIDFARAIARGISDFFSS